MKKNKKHSEHPEEMPAAPPASEPEGTLDAFPRENILPEPLPEITAPPSALKKNLSRNRLRRLVPDIIKVATASLVIGIAVTIWLTPPLIKSDFPRVSYTFGGTTYTNALLYRPLSMPTRYYIALPEKIANRYQMFAVDRRREVAAMMTNALPHSFFGFPAIKRSDALGLDLEFRHLDNSVWNVFFYPDAILFSNAVLSVRLDAK